MTLICPKCQGRLQLDETKTPSQPFTIRCPKCQAAVKRTPSDWVNESSSTEALLVSDFHLERSVAPRFSLNHDVSASQGNASAAVEISDLAKVLAQALGLAKAEGFATGRAKGPRKVLVCASPAYREVAACALAENNYEVFVAENTQQALGRMREENMDVVLLDANFDPAEQGTAFVMREVKTLRPAQRRRVFLVYVSSSIRTMDLHAAFLHNVNFVFNPSDIDQLPEALDASLRNYNQLYRDFFAALNVPAI